MAQKETDSEKGPSEEGFVLDKSRIAWVSLMDELVLGERAEILFVAIANELEVSRHMVDYRAEAGEAGGNDRLVVLQDQLDRILLQLSKERLAWMFQQRHHHFESASNVADDLVV